jgi:flagellar motor switch protein FliN
LWEFSPQIEEMVKKENFFEIDILCNVGAQKMEGILLIPASFRAQWKKQLREIATPLDEGWSKKLEIDLSCEMGFVDLEKEEYKAIRKGDVILLDQCSYDPDEKEGWVVLTAGFETLFRGRLKKGGIKILEYPRIEEDKKMMDEEDKFEPLEEEIFEIVDDTSALPQNASQVPLPSFEKLPVRVSIEVARLKMTIDELTKLSPGSLLDLAVSPELGVDLVVNGKKIAKGDLVKVGDVMGVRIR